MNTLEHLRVKGISHMGGKSIRDQILEHNGVVGEEDMLDDGDMVLSILFRHCYFFRGEVDFCFV